MLADSEKPLLLEKFITEPRNLLCSHTNYHYRISFEMSKTPLAPNIDTTSLARSNYQE